MSISDDPRGFRRGQPDTAQYPAGDGRADEQRQQPRQDPRNGARPLHAPRQDEQYAASPREPGDGQRQPSFSAFRPEAYAAAGGDKPNGRPERANWPQADNQFTDPRAADKRPAPPRPQPEPYRPAPNPERARPHGDPYANGASDPYDAGRENGWQSQNYQDPQPASQYQAANYYQHHDEADPADVQSVHDRFFAADSETERMAAPAPQAARYQNDDFGGQDYAAPAREPKRAAKSAGKGAVNGNPDDGGDYRWDNYDAAPAPESVRPFPQVKLGGGQHEELDADYFADEDEFEDDYAEPKKSGSKKLMAAVLIGAVVTGGGLAYLYKAQTGRDGSEPPIMTADARPIKEKPSDPGGREFPNGGKLIYDRLDGANVAGSGGDEPTRLASRDESNAAGGPPGVVTTGASGTLEERIQNALRDAKKQDDAPVAATSNTYDTPRSVQTQIFRPDGSVDGRVQRRQAPADTDAPVLSSGPSPKGVAAREAPPAAAPSAAAPARNTAQQIAAATPAAGPTPSAAITSGGDAGMFVQIAARNDQAAAMAAFADLQQKYASVLGNHSPSVRKVDLGDKGVWYRLLVGPMASKGDADKLCDDLKTAGMKGCFSRKE